MDPHASRNVGHNVLISTLLGAAYGASFGLIKRSSSILFAGTTGASCLIASTIFFGIREWAATPMLRPYLDNTLYGPEAQFVSALSPEAPQPDWSKMRLYHLPDSAAAGALTGGALNSLRRGRAGIIPGAVTISLAAGVIQYVFNEGHIARVQLVAHEVRTGRLAELQSAPPKPIQERVLEALSMIAPIRKLSDEEYIRITEKKKAEVEARLKVIDEELKAIDDVDQGKA